MADLENLLLEAAGRTSSAGKSRHSHSSSRRRRGGSYSDGGSDSRGDDSDDGRGYASRKPSGTQVPLKKRLDPTEMDDEQGSQEEGDYNDSGSDRGGDSNESDVGSDLYKDEDDRRKLAEMSELQRELILSDRAQKKDDKSLKEKFRPKWDKGKTTHSRKETPPLPSSRVRSSARSADRAAAKDDALNELRAKRLKQQDPEAHRKLRDASRGSSGSRSFSHMTRKSFTAVGRSSSSQSDSDSRSHSEDEGSTGEDAMMDSDDERSEGLTFDDIKEITTRRSKLAKWLMEPFFEELIVGCFVRVGIGRSKSGPIYRLCMVRNVDASDPDRKYKLENKTTHKYLNVVWGNENSAARWQMAMISDSAPLEEEFKQWVREVERSGGRLPSKQDVLEKKEAIKKINTFVYSAATVKQMIEEKKSASSRPLNIALEKDRLRRELEVAQSKHDDAEVERIKTRLQQLEARRQSQGKDSKAVRLAEMNRKNRVENFKNASELKPVKTGLKAQNEEPKIPKSEIGRMAESSSSGLTFKLHPLVIVNISDHYSRVKSQMHPPITNTATATTTPPPNNGAEGAVETAPSSSSSSALASSPRVFGCVIGVQRGRTVEIFNSFELLYDPATHSLDRAFLEKKQELYKKVFPHFYILGWYSTGTDAQESDMNIHKALMDINESPVYVLLNPLINPAQKDLPITIYESELHVIDGIPQLIFVSSSYTIETVEAERISVDHVAHLKPSDGGSAATQLAAHLTGIHSAIKMLNSRIRVLHHYLLAMQKGDIPCENSLLRQVSSLLRRLPAIESGKFQDDFLMEYNDTLLITSLAVLTNCSSTMNELVDKFNTAYDRHTRRGGRTTFF